MKEMKKYAGNLGRMFCCLFRLVPRLFVLVTGIAVLEAILPYVNVIAAQLIVDGLLEQRAVGVIIRIVLIATGLNVLFRVILGCMKKWREASEVRMELEFQKKIHVQIEYLHVVSSSVYPIPFDYSVGRRRGQAHGTRFSSSGFRL